jgi:glucokinase
MILGIDIGGTITKFGIFKNKQFIEKSEIQTNAKSGFNSTFTNITEKIRQSTLNYIINSIGIGIPGVISSDGTLLYAPNLPEWDGVNIKQKFEQMFDIPLSIENDANTAAIAELELGSGKYLNNFLYITIGTGIGGTIIINREIFRGDDGGAGEIGHIIIDKNESQKNNSSPYRTGVLEEFTGRNKIIELAKFYASKQPDSMLNSLAEFDVKDISLFAESGDKAAQQCLKEIGFYLGIGIASALNLLGIHNVIIGGGIAYACDYLFEEVLITVKQRALPGIATNITFQKAAFGNDAGITGAAILAEQKIRENHIA